MFASFVKDSYIAPGLSRFTNAEIPDLSDICNRMGYWGDRFFLNSVIRRSFEPKMRAYMFNYFRRCEGSFCQHALARAETMRFIQGSREAQSVYVSALLHWEIYLGQSWHAMRILQKAFRFTLFERDDGSVESRLNGLYNQMKHVESRIDEGKISENATIPVWMTNEGLQGLDAQLTWHETGEVLKDLAKWADVFVDPYTAKEKLSRLNEQSSIIRVK